MKILEEARKLITENWTTGEYARDKTGRPVSILSDEAVKFCAVGAVNLISLGSAHEERTAAYGKLSAEAKNRGYGSIFTANDVGGQSVILEIFDACIAQK